ncbi:MAG TPA: IclR family transcriptional regulator [Bryobacteraceae bacterium]|nr:IclR family transcriptional regulator [Bryobacteraceae bacterium]
MKPATTITKVCRVLGEFKSRPSLGITDLARRTALLPSDVHRILTSLQLYGYVEQDLETKRYRLGAGLLRLGLTTFQRNVLHEKGRPILMRLSEQLEAATHLAMLDIQECEVFLVDQVDPPVDVLFKARLGSTASAHSTALGKTIMASMDRQTLLEVLERTGLPKITGHTITDLAALESEFQMIRQRGYAVDQEESVEGACCIGCPVRNCASSVIGAISASMTADRFRVSNRTRLATQVEAAALELSAALGYDPRGMGQYRCAG